MSMYMGVQVPMETRRIRSPGDGVTRGCDLPDMGAENRSQSSLGAASAVNC